MSYKYNFSFCINNSCIVDTQLICTFFVWVMDSMVPLFVKSEISCFLYSSVAVQAGLCQIWSDRPPADRFSHTLNHVLFFRFEVSWTTQLLEQW